MALYGFHRHPDSLEVRRALSALAPCIAASGQPLGDRRAGMALFGLRAQPDSAASRAVIAALLPRLAAAEKLRPTYWSLCMYGLQGQGNSEALRGLLRLMHDRIPLRTLDDAPAAQALTGLVGLAAANVDVGELLRGVARRLPADPRAPGVLQVMRMAGIQPPAGPPAVQPTQGSARERMLRNLLMRAGVRGLRFNVAHHSGFELDILCGSSLNIEIDGASVAYHGQGKQRLQVLRGQVLASHGISVHRVPAAGRSLSEVVAAVALACGADAESPEWRQAAQLAERGWDGLLYENKGRLVCQVIALDGF
eukprot:TRINITY_DN19869_c0_g1_i1.p1 TRINITY_DN19869_c0_g1~~TRINITY_DN19869_c0_g1_i1.p1  ORF type:complete len:349 (+),score=55.19 TRINITY_DN19869_c0_g1_i1:123-1049(+)